MKKVLFATLVAAVALFCSCEKKPGKEDSGITSITVKPSNTTLAEGATLQMTVVPTPSGLKGVYTWTSSDTTICTVNAEGLVTAVGAGTAYITAKEANGVEGKSEIKVTSFLESFQWGEACVYNFQSKDTVGAPIDEITAGDGKKYRAYFIPNELWVMSEGFYITDEGDLGGSEDGLIITMPAHMYWAPKELNPGMAQGTIFCLGLWEIVKDSSDVSTLVGEPGVYGEGVLTNVLAGWDAYNAGQSPGEYFKAAGEAVTGTTMKYYYYDVPEGKTEGGYYSNWVPDAVLTNAAFYMSGNAESSSEFMIGVDAGKFVFNALKGDWLGVNATYDEENEKIIINDRSKLMITDDILVEWGEFPVQNAASNKALRPVKMLNDDPAINKAMLDKMANQKGIKVLRINK